MIFIQLTKNNLKELDHLKKIKDNYIEGKLNSVVIAGRLMSKRIMGKAAFAELQDAEGKIQLYINR